MSETTAVFWMIVIFALRIGLPLVLTLIGGSLWNSRMATPRESDTVRP